MNLTNCVREALERARNGLVREYFIKEKKGPNRTYTDRLKEPEPPNNHFNRLFGDRRLMPPTG